MIFISLFTFSFISYVYYRTIYDIIMGQPVTNDDLDNSSDDGSDNESDDGFDNGSDNGSDDGSDNGSDDGSDEMDSFPKQNSHDDITQEYEIIS